MTPAITMLIIMAALVYCMDVSGFVQSFRERFKIPVRLYRLPFAPYEKTCSRHTFRMPLSDPFFDKPFFCSRCLTFWAGAALAVCHLSWSWLLFGCLFSWFAPYFHMIIIAIQDVFVFLFDRITKHLNK